MLNDASDDVIKTLDVNGGFDILTIKEEEGEEVGQFDLLIKEEHQQQHQQHLSNCQLLNLTPVQSSTVERRRARGRGRGRGRTGFRGKRGKRGRGGRCISAERDIQNEEHLIDKDPGSVKKESSDSGAAGLLEPLVIKEEANDDAICLLRSVLGSTNAVERGQGRGRSGRKGRSRGRGRGGGTGNCGRLSIRVKDAEATRSNVDLIKEEEETGITEEDDDKAMWKDASTRVKIRHSARLRSSAAEESGGYQCRHCMKLFKSEMNLNQHVRWMHGVDRLPSQQPSLWFFQTQCHTVAHAVAALCDGTKSSIASDRPASAMEKKDSCPKNQVKCRICQAVFRTSYSLLVHSRMHSGASLFSCKICDQNFITRGHLAKHSRTHSDQLQKDSATEDHSMECHEGPFDLVGESLSAASLPVLSLTDCDVEEREMLSVIIPDVESSSSDTDTLSRVSPTLTPPPVSHSTSEDLEKVAYGGGSLTQAVVGKGRGKRKPSLCGLTRHKIDCQVCGKTFTTKYSLLIHSRIHTGEKPFSCDICNLKFYTSSHLVTHRRTHTGEKPYQCKDCGKSFSSSNPLRRHEQSFHSTLRPYICEFCAKTFKFKENLRLHIARRHSAKKQVKCSMCDLTFTDRKQARRHERFKHRAKAKGYEETSEKEYKCSFCFLSFKELEQVKQHKVDVHEADVGVLHPYKCNICNKAYVWRGGLREHMLKHSGERRFECEICAKKFFSREVLKRHSITHTDVRPFSCSVCNRRFKSKGVMDKHAVRFHFGEKQYSCEVCGKQFFTATELKTHKSFHTEEKLFACEICDARVKTQMSLKRHMISHGERKFSCETCGKQFFTELHMKRHQMIHTGEKPFNCYLCSRKFHTKKNLGRHMVSHGDKRYTCDVCQKKFVTEMDKKIHEAFHCVGRKAFSCHLCSRSFSAKKTLKRHLLLHNVGNHYSCEFCGQVYASAVELESHKRLHSREKPYECVFCDEKFRQKENLKGHLMVHSGEKQHECDLCGKKFQLRQYLRQHLKIHTGTKPYTCCTCNKQYVWRRDLMIHYRRCRATALEEMTAK